MRWRPGYPPEVLEALRTDLGLAAITRRRGRRVPGPGSFRACWWRTGTWCSAWSPIAEMAAVAEADSAPAADSTASTGGRKPPASATAPSMPSPPGGPPLVRGAGVAGGVPPHPAAGRRGRAGLEPEARGFHAVPPRLRGVPAPMVQRLPRGQRAIRPGRVAARPVRGGGLAGATVRRRAALRFEGLRGRPV